MCSFSQLVLSLRDGGTQRLLLGWNADLLLGTMVICAHRKLRSWRKTLFLIFANPPAAMHHLRFGASTAGHSLSPVYMIINALSAGKRHYERCVNMCEDGSNKLLITISGSVSVRFRAKYWPCGAILKMLDNK